VRAQSAAAQGVASSPDAASLGAASAYTPTGDRDDICLDIPSELADQLHLTERATIFLKMPDDMMIKF
jgi:hypothetical protein